MHRIDSTTATPDNRFTEGDPTIPVAATTVTADWLNAVQEELCAVIAGASLPLDKENNSQLLQALCKIIDRRAPIAAKVLCKEFYAFAHPEPDPGFEPLTGCVIENAAVTYPEAWAWLQTVAGQKMCLSETAWQELSAKGYYTLADGTAVGFNGIGGVPFYAPDLSTGALRMPDIRGTYAEPAGFDGLAVGGLSIDTMRPVTAFLHAGSAQTGAVLRRDTGALPRGAFEVSNGDGALPTVKGTSLPGAQLYGHNLYFKSANVAPVGAATAPRHFGVLACAWLGLPAA